MNTYGRVLLVDLYRDCCHTRDDTFSRLYTGLARDLSFVSEQYQALIEDLLLYEESLLSFLAHKNNHLVAETFTELARRAGFAGGLTAPVVAPEDDFLDTFAPLLEGSSLNFFRGPSPLGTFIIREDVLCVSLLTYPGVSSEQFCFQVPLFP